MKCFNGFCKDGVIQASTVDEILKMMGLRVQKEVLDAIISEVDEDGKNDFLRQITTVWKLQNCTHM